jgi:hypothetical protein
VYFSEKTLLNLSYEILYVTIFWHHFMK